ncbi:MAG TPA: LmeA family phospholipid-binding protein [Acidimicrobiales bacterium]|nr:LmeA family phospholipid-binding protein [Acidimicrobiales bacterium]
MRRLLIALAILLVVLVVGDFVAKAYATSQLRDRAERAVRGATSSTASISSFPFTGRLLLAGSVPKVDVRVGPVVAGRVTFASISVDLHDVHVDRNRLINDQQVQLTGLGSGTVTAELTDVEVSRLAGTRVTFAPGRVMVSAAGVDVAASVQVTNGSMSFGGLRLPIQLRIPRAPLFPCDATSAVVKEGAVDLSCTVHDVPPELVGKTLK